MDFERNDNLGNVDISTLLQDLESYVEKCSRVPLTGKIMVDGDYVLETIDRINAILPEEMKRARQLVEQSDQIIENVEARGKKLLEDARAKAERIVQETEIVQMAQQEAERIIKEATDYGDNLVIKANERSEQVISEAEAYVNSLLVHLESNLDKVAVAVKSTRENFEIDRQG